MRNGFRFAAAVFGRLAIASRTLALYFANCCNLEDGSDYLVLFKIDLQIEKVLPDYDEIRI